MMVAELTGIREFICGLRHDVCGQGSSGYKCSALACATSSEHPSTLAYNTSKPLSSFLGSPG